MKALLKSAAAILVLISLLTMSCTKETVIDQPSMVEFKAAPTTTTKPLPTAIPATIQKDK